MVKFIIKKLSQEREREDIIKEREFVIFLFT
jgi:hypothetical protein